MTQRTRKLALLSMVGVLALTSHVEAAGGAYRLSSGWSATVASGEGEPVIEAITLGQRVLPTTAECENVNLDNWRRVELELDTEDGEFSVALLCSREWIAAHGATVGRQLHLDLDDLNVSGDARITNIAEQPTIERGPGCVVTGTLLHNSASLVRVHLEGGTHFDVTSAHRLYSATRARWVPAGELGAEVLQTREGTVAITFVDHAPQRPQDVFNIEVLGTHRYFVGDNEVLAHNTYSSGLFGRVRDFVKSLSTVRLRRHSSHDFGVSLRRADNSRVDFGRMPTGNANLPNSIGGRYTPHYHRRRLGPDGVTLPGQGIGRHRPWEARPGDESFWDRF